MPDAAVIYTRISDAGQSIHSLDTQQEACHTYAAQHGYQVIGSYSDGHSGAVYRDRPELTALREQVRLGGVTVVIAYALDRISRNQSHLYILDEEFREHGARLEFVTERYEDTPVGRLIRSVMSFVAEIEREKIIERSTRGRHARVRSGKLLPGPRPLYGYALTPDRAAYVPNPDTAPIVERIFREIQEGRALGAVCQRLDQDGIPTPAGAPAWTVATISRIIKHPNYGGANVGWAWRPSGDTSYSRYDAAGAVALADGAVPPIVSQDTWDDANAVLSSNRQRARFNRDHTDRGLLRGGHARCAHCDYPLYLVVRHGRLVYHCESRHRHGSGCTYHSMQMDDLDRQAWEWVIAETSQSRYRDATATVTAPAPVDRLDWLDRRLASIDRQLTNSARELAREDDPDVASAIRSAMRDLTGQRRDLDNERRALDLLSAQDDARRAVADDLSAWLASVSDRLESMGFHERRLVVESLDLEAALARRGTVPRLTFRARAFG